MLANRTLWPSADGQQALKPPSDQPGADLSTNTTATAGPCEAEKPQFSWWKPAMRRVAFHHASAFTPALQPDAPLGCPT